jgi:cytochrome c biogenesis protein CcdA
MIALLALVVSVGIVDSINPSTLGPALLFALGRNGAVNVARFTLGVFAVSTVGGLVLVLGPGRALLHLLSTPSPHTAHVLAVAGGIALLVAAAVLWSTRERVRRHLNDERVGSGSGRSALLLGAGIMAVELPTAFPYIGALAAVVATNHSVLAGIVLVLVYNVVFVAPLLAVLVAVAAGGARGEQLTLAARVWLERHGAELIPAALGLLGIAITLYGVIGLL